MADDDRIDLQEVIAEMDPVGRLYFDNAQLRVALKRVQAENQRLRAEQTPAGEQ